jgi:hypothetical protein
VPQILNAASDLTAIELSKRVSDSHNHPEGVALAPFWPSGLLIAHFFLLRNSSVEKGLLAVNTPSGLSALDVGPTKTWLNTRVRR